MDEFAKLRVLDFLANKIDEQITKLWKSGDEAHNIIYLAHSVSTTIMSDETKQKLVDALNSVDETKKKLDELKEVIYKMRKL